jgi:predicted transcriptional regulator
MEPSRTGYTTTLKLMQIMNAKGLVARDEGQRSHIYRARFTEDQVQRHVVGQLLERLFDGSAPKLVMQALAATRATPAELAEIRDLVQRMEGGKK